MAAKLSSGGGGRYSEDQNAEINVTPFVDVMLVLLIIFMVAAPLMTVGVPIDLPKTQAKQLNTDQKPITISVNNEGLIFVGEQPVQLANIIEAVTAATPNGIEDRVYVRGDTSASYGTVMEVMGALSGAGFTKIGLLTDQAQKQP